jgi:hypothetical protein
MPAGKPDYTDPGYGELGCLVNIVGILVGSVVSMLLLPFLPTRLPAGGQDLMLRLLGIATLAYVAGTVASVVAMSVVGRVRALWNGGETLVFLVGLIAAAMVVPLGVYVGVIGRWAGSITLLAAAAFVFYLLFALARHKERPRRSRSDGHR